MERSAPEFRPARWWDVPALADIDADLFGTDAWSQATFWSELAGIPTRRWYCVAQEAGRILGYVGLGVGEGTGDVQTLAVAAAAQGRGLGAMLLDALLEQARERGCAEVLLEVRADNAPAIALYLRRGFVVISTRRRYYSDGTDAMILHRDMGSGARSYPV